MPFYIVISIPVIVAALALITHHVVAKMAVPVVCAAIIAAVAAQDLSTVTPLLFALVASAVGDYFLSNKGNREVFFIYGIAAYLLAHIGYGLFAVLNGSFSIVVLLASLAIFLPYYGAVLRPKIEDPVLSLSVLAYLVISCAVLAAAAGLSAPVEIRLLYITAIALIVLSDFVISLYEFAGARNLQFLILPTYYGAHVLITVAMMLGLR